METIPIEKRSFKDRISWSAIIGGLVAALAFQLVLTLLGLAIGFTTIDPYAANPFNGLGMGALIWLVISMVASLFVGGWVAGHLAGVPVRMDAALNGALVWAVFLVAGILLTGSGVAGVFSGIGSAASKGVQSAAGQGGSVIEDLLAKTEKPELQPQNLKQNLEEVAKSAANQPANQPQQAEQAAKQQAQQSLQQTKQALDSQALANVIANSTGLSKEEANRLVTQAQTAAGQTDIEGSARRVGANVADFSAKVAWGLFGLTIVTLLAGAIGGLAGTPKTIVEARV